MLILHECADLRLVALGLLVVAVAQVYFKNGAVGDVRSTTVSSTIGDSVRARLILRAASFSPPRKESPVHRWRCLMFRTRSWQESLVAGLCVL